MYFTVVMDLNAPTISPTVFSVEFLVGAIPCDGFSVGAIPCGCPSSILFWSTVGESFLYGSTVLGIVFILGRPRGSPLRDSFYFG